MSRFQKATKRQARLRAALYGPSGAGKTYTALSVASGLGDRIAVIDTERGSASKYADRFAFDVLDLAKHTVKDYVAAIADAAKEGYPVLVIDSLSHGWQELLEENDRLANTKYRGNTWSAWSESTPKQKALVAAILEYPGHVIATMRSKTAWETAEDNRGKKAPQRIGLAPEQGKGIEYEFDLLAQINVDHVLWVEKDRTGKFQDTQIAKPGVEFGRELAAWLEDGESAPVAAPYAPKMPAPSHPDNGSGHGRGQYASPEQEAAYEKWISEAIEFGITQWLDAWTNRADGTIPPEAQDALTAPVGGDWNRVAIQRHLVTWAIREGHLDPSIVPEEAKARQNPKYLAILHAKGNGTLKALKGELRAFMDDACIRARERLLKLRPDLAGDDGDDIPMREPGDDGDE